MKIYHMQTNHQNNPLGIALDPLVFTWRLEKTNEEHIENTMVNIYQDERCIYISQGEVSSLGYHPDVSLQPRTSYSWEVVIQTTSGTTVSERAFFETGKMNEKWQAVWIEAPFKQKIQPIFRHEFKTDKKVIKARIYAHAAGLYELYLNGHKVGDEYLMPGYHSYHLFKQVQTYDVTHLIGTDNALAAFLGDGWYKGRFVFDGGQENIYGDTLKLIAECHVLYEDGSEEIIKTDKLWKAAAGPILSSSIYDGEVLDDNLLPVGFDQPGFDDSDWMQVTESHDGIALLCDRVNLPIIKKAKITPVALIHTPKDEWVLDFGQNMTGWVEFVNRLDQGQRMRLSYGEVLQNDCFYRDNLRTAKAQFDYVSDGVIGKTVRPHFTFYGFRYVKVEGLEHVNPQDFTAYLIGSDMSQTGFIKTSNDKINQLFHNALWGQMDNFLDIPTDCPQRDERMGWTGDAGIISRVACENFDAAAFFNHYLVNISHEQAIRGGSVPNFVPTPPLKNAQGLNPFLEFMDNGISIWGDAGTLIPWHVYLSYGDPYLLEKHYPIMKDWVDYIHRQDIQGGDHGLWLTGDHLGDWLAIDTDDSQSPFGATDLYFTASAFYYHSCHLLVRSAEILNKQEDVQFYDKLKQKIRRAFLDKYYDASGALTIQPTQTACVLALYFHLYEEKSMNYLKTTLRDLIAKKNDHLDTGFAGSPFICLVLSEYGMDDLAYTLLLNEDYPSWLFAVNMGATTIWERWNSLLEDGSISGTGMNSLNHYAYGSVVDWMYRYMGGLQPQKPGYQEVKIEPHTDPRIQKVDVIYDSASGQFAIHWHYQQDGSVVYDFKIPSGVKAYFECHGQAYVLTGGTYHFE